MLKGFATHTGCMKLYATHLGVRKFINDQVSTLMPLTLRSACAGQDIGADSRHAASVMEQYSQVAGV